MIAAKTKLFHEDLQRKARLFKVLSHPARLQILLYLARSRNCLSGDISEMFPIKRTTVNQHIKELREAGLIEEQLRESKNVYCLNIPEIAKAAETIEEFLGEITLPKDFSCKYKPGPLTFNYSR